MLALDPANPVVALCAAGMQLEGEPDKARPLFEQAWATRSNDLEASIAAHYLARHQESAADRLHWNAIALRHADALPVGEARDLLPSLCLNLADSLLALGRADEARAIAHRGRATLDALAPDGYSAFLRLGFERLHERLARASSTDG